MEDEKSLKNEMANALRRVGDVVEDMYLRKQRDDVGRAVFAEVMAMVERGESAQSVLDKIGALAERLKGPSTLEQTAYGLAGMILGRDVTPPDDYSIN
jgi:hypothetical protein